MPMYYYKSQYMGDHVLSQVILSHSKWPPYTVTFHNIDLWPPCTVTCYSTWPTGSQVAMYCDESHSTWDGSHNKLHDYSGF